MNTRTLGATGLTVSEIGLGCMAMSYAYGQPSSEQEAFAALHRAIELGITFLDTAEMYGPFENERLLGRALKGRRDEVTIATKFGFKINPDPTRRAIDSMEGVDGRPEHVIEAVNGSLQRLNVDTIDLLYQHRPDPSVPIEDTVGAMADLVKAGKVKHLGLSEVSPELLRRAHAVHPITALQSEYSLWFRDVEQDILPTCRELGIGFVPFSPLGRGFLTGSIKGADMLPEGDFRRLLPRFQQDAITQNLRLVEALTQMAQARGCTSAQLALAWLLAQGDDIAPIPGARRIKHLEENAAASEIVMSPAELDQLHQLLAAHEIVGERYGERTKSFLNTKR